MRVRVYHVDQSTGAETFDSECWLYECFSTDEADAEEEFMEAELQLREQGRAYLGGGAAQLVLLMAVRS